MSAYDYFYRIIVTEKNPDNYIKIIETLGDKSIRGEEVDAYIVSTTQKDIKKLSFDWITKIEPYDSYVQAIF